MRVITLALLLRATLACDPWCSKYNCRPLCEAQNGCSPSCEDCGPKQGCAAGEKQTLIHGGIALPVAKPTPRTAVRAPKARSKKKARARGDPFDEDDDGMDGMSGVGV